MPMHVPKLKDFVFMQTNVGKVKQKFSEREREREGGSIICVFVNHMNIFHWKIKYQLNVTKIETS